MSLGETEERSCVFLTQSVLHFSTCEQFASADVGMCKQSVTKLGRVHERETVDGPQHYFCQGGREGDGDICQSYAVFSHTSSMEVG